MLDKFDKRLLNTYLNEYLGDFLFNSFQAFRFYGDDRAEYAMPSDAASFRDIFGKHDSTTNGARARVCVCVADLAVRRSPQFSFAR